VAGVGIGNLALPPVIESLIDSYGWRVALRCVAVAIFCASMFAASLLRRRITVVRKFEFGPVLRDRRFQVTFVIFIFIFISYFSCFFVFVSFSFFHFHFFILFAPFSALSFLFFLFVPFFWYLQFSFLL